MWAPHPAASNASAHGAAPLLDAADALKELGTYPGGMHDPKEEQWGPDSRAGSPAAGQGGCWWVKKAGTRGRVQGLGGLSWWFC
jgi:hypothetical protein